MGNFYPRVINKTDITFTSYESTLLNKGLKYNLNHKHKKMGQKLFPCNLKCVIPVV